ncbi:Pre-mRNA-splicing regulator female-lethal(2)D [Halotydeus destructor]|nr:Pre-mRNA-splicing regulator female-lethal(2)D [Halotydeus destructor]
MKKSQSELDEFLLELDEDVEGMQSTIYFLQQQLKEAKQALAKNATNGINDAESFSSQAPSSSSVKQLDIVENGKNSGTALEPDETTPMQCD